MHPVSFLKCFVDPHTLCGMPCTPRRVRVFLAAGFNALRQGVGVYFRYRLLVTGYLFLLLPRFAYAAEFTALDLLNNISTFVINPLIYVLFSAAFLVFIWGLVQFVAHLDSEEARSTGGTHMVWGIIGMVIMVSVNPIVDLIIRTIESLGQ